MCAGVAALAATFPARAGDAARALAKPGWDYFDSASFAARHGAACVNATAGGRWNARWAFYALPEGAPPAGGWPVYFIFPPWPTAPSSAPTACGISPLPAPVPSCMALLKRRCSNASTTSCRRCVKRLEDSSPAAYRAANCTPVQAQTVWCKHHGHGSSHQARPVFLDPAKVASACFLANGSYTGSYDPACQFVSVNGQLWWQRALQYFLANGVAVVQSNPWQEDSWDWQSQHDWEFGFDRPFLRVLFEGWRSGAFAGLGKNVLNPRKLLLSGYSVGSQMVSWMYELQARGELRDDFGAQVAAGAMFAGGSHACYRSAAHPSPDDGVPPNQSVAPSPLRQCRRCNASADCYTVGCSNTVAALTGRQPCCAFCCPANFTEQYYADHPDAYDTHPPTFLVQHTTLDENADTCAARNYHATMVAHGARSHLALIPVDRERCYCVGEAGDSSSAGSPVRRYCPGFYSGLPPYRPGVSKHPPIRPAGTNVSGAYEDHSTERCVMHTMGFSDMVEPLVDFFLRALDGAGAA